MKLKQLQDLNFLQNFYSPYDFAILCQVHPNTVYHWIKSGYISYVKRGSRYYIPETCKPPVLRSGPKRR